MEAFAAGGKTVTLYPADAADAPVLVLPVYDGDGADVAQALAGRQAPPAHLAVIGGLDWGGDMTPWPCPPLSKYDAPCTGGADRCLAGLTERILPEAERRMGARPCWRGIAGYSLAGLFALYTLYRTDVFSRAASVSGSLWFLRFLEYAEAHAPAALPERVYFSLGGREARTRHPLMKTVQARTEAVERLFRARGAETVFVQNRGGHFTDPAGRTAAGIDWLLRG